MSAEPRSPRHMQVVDTVTQCYDDQSAEDYQRRTLLVTTRCSTLRHVQLQFALECICWRRTIVCSKLFVL